MKPEPRLCLPAPRQNRRRRIKPQDKRRAWLSQWPRRGLLGLLGVGVGRLGSRRGVFGGLVRAPPGFVQLGELLGGRVGTVVLRAQRFGRSPQGAE